MISPQHGAKSRCRGATRAHTARSLIASTPWRLPTHPQVANCLIMCRPTTVEAAEAWMAANPVGAPLRLAGDTRECAGAFERHTQKTRHNTSHTHITCNTSHIPCTRRKGTWEWHAKGNGSAGSELSARPGAFIVAYSVRFALRAGKGQSPHCRPSRAGGVEGTCARESVSDWLCPVLPSLLLSGTDDWLLNMQEMYCDLTDTELARPARNIYSPRAQRSISER